ncbi:MAG TPA: MBL fold metallo-hydrolase [Anaerolineae bacterium]|nr:MBL fold metallo-hydrolase [Anaerolineae bacterium]
MTLAETADVAITVVVDNYSNVLLKSQPGVDRYEEDEPVLAEHGFSVHIRLGALGPQILLDAGFSQVALPHNLSLLGIDARAVDQVVISHGHPDHTGALEIFLRLAWKRTPVVVHPDAFLERWDQLSDGSKEGPWQQDRQVWENAGAEIVSLVEPYELAPGCLATGPIHRRTDFEKVAASALYRQGTEFVSDPIRDDQAVVINVREKGLVVIAGCAHSGIVNTVVYAQEISGVDRLWAVVGGFHLDGAAQDKVRRTVAELKALGPHLVMPCHCTGFEAARRFAEKMPGQFLLGAVGTTLKF